MLEILNARKISKLQTEEFLKSIPLNNVKIGCSFSPEQFDNLDDAIKSLEITINDLNIKDIRLGIRWNQVLKDDEIDITYYKPFIDLCIKSNVNICLNVGPIKTFRWPEEHVPNSILSKLTHKPRYKEKISSDSEIAEIAFSYYEKLLKKINSAYVSQDLSAVKIIQFENEAFFPFGKNKWHLSYRYMIALTEITNNYFPNSFLLINSAGRLNLKNIITFFDLLNENNISAYNQMILGYDYYYKFPPLAYIPFFRMFDNLSLGWPFLLSCKGLLKESLKKGFNIEVTECQMEPWDDIVSPGNSYDEFKYTITRLTKSLENSEKPLLIRIWGVEELTKKFIKSSLNTEHSQIISLIQKINS